MLRVDRAVWEVYVRERLVGYVGWFGGRRLVADLGRDLRPLARAWFADAHPDRHAIVGERRVDAFVTGVLAPRLGGRARQVDPATLPATTWLRWFEAEPLEKGVRDPTGYRTNRFQWPPDPADLLAGTEQGRYRWQPGRHGSFRAGGWLEDEVAWLVLGREGWRFKLVISREQDVQREPLVQEGGWFLRCDLQRLHGWLEARASRRAL